jgi:hypothetical protein
MMMREFEVIIWACINSKEQLDQEGILRDGEKETPQKKILYRLLMTAFYLKEKYCKKHEFDVIKAYFVQNFPQFLGKYTTEWLLLAEPDMSFLTPRALN